MLSLMADVGDGERGEARSRRRIAGLAGRWLLARDGMGSLACGNGIGDGGFLSSARHSPLSSGP